MTAILDTTDHLAGHARCAAQHTVAREVTPSAQASFMATPKGCSPAQNQLPEGQSPADAHRYAALGDQLAESGAKSTPKPTTPPPRSLLDPAIYTLAATVTDLEGSRKAQANRLRILTTIEADSDGVVRGFGLDETHPGVAMNKALLDQIEALEHNAVLDLQRAMRRHPLWAGWGKSQTGVGEKTLARLLAAIGDPYIRGDNGQPRTVSQLWAYCGLHVIGGSAAKRQKGVQANWSTDAKMRTFLIAEGLVKSGVRTIDKTVDEKAVYGGAYPLGNRASVSEYGAVYLARRATTIDRVHATDCVRCGPSGKPALAGTPWSGAHQQADALRFLSKRVLRDLWRVARDWHESD